MSYDQVVVASGGDDASSGVVVTVLTIWGSFWGLSEVMAFVVASWGGGIWTFTVVVSSTRIVSLVGVKASDDAGRSGWSGGRSLRCYWIWWSIAICWSWWACISAIFWKRAMCVVVSVWKICIRLQNSEAEMVMEDSDVVGEIGGTIWVIEGAAEVASGLGTGGIVSVGSSPCSGCGGTGGATMGGTPRGEE